MIEKLFGARPRRTNDSPRPEAPSGTNHTRRAGVSRYAATTHPMPIATPRAALSHAVSSSRIRVVRQNQEDHGCDKVEKGPCAADREKWRARHVAQGRDVG